MSSGWGPRLNPGTAGAGRAHKVQVQVHKVHKVQVQAVLTRGLCGPPGARLVWEIARQTKMRH
jgi:hypothetical protein